MPFDPTKPTDHAPITSAELRAQFTALKALIDTKADTVTVNNLFATDTAGSFNLVEYPNLTISNPPTQAQVQAILDLVIAILDAGRRA